MESIPPLVPSDDLRSDLTLDLKSAYMQVQKAVWKTAVRLNQKRMDYLFLTLMHETCHRGVKCVTAGSLFIYWHRQPEEARSTCL